MVLVAVSSVTISLVLLVPEPDLRIASLSLFGAALLADLQSSSVAQYSGMIYLLHYAQ